MASGHEGEPEPSIVGASDHPSPPHLRASPPSRLLTLKALIRAPLTLIRAPLTLIRAPLTLIRAPLTA